MLFIDDGFSPRETWESQAMEFSPGKKAMMTSNIPNDNYGQEQDINHKKLFGNLKILSYGCEKVF